MRLSHLTLLLATACAAMAQRPPLPTQGTFSNLRFIPGPDDTVGYELTLLPGPGATWVMFTCAQGELTEPVFVKANEDHGTLRFRVEVKDGVCNGDWRARPRPTGLVLDQLPAGAMTPETLPRRRSYFLLP